MPKTENRSHQLGESINIAGTDHVVHFYPLDNELVKQLLEYIGEGLEKGETCVVIATPAHVAALNKGLRLKGINLATKIENHSYIALDAEELLASFMQDNQAMSEKFLISIGSLMQLAATAGKPIRAFGEMVGILLEQNNFKAVIEVEEYWNELINKFKFSLYCGYPESSFIGRPNDKAIIEKICNCHHSQINLAI